MSGTHTNIWGASVGPRACGLERHSYPLLASQLEGGFRPSRPRSLLRLLPGPRFGLVHAAFLVTCAHRQP